MIQKMFAAYDSAAKAYLSPFQLPREEMAIRAFTDVVNSKNHDFANHPEDYALFLLGEFDNRTGQFLCHTPGPKCVCTALEVRNVPKPEMYQDETQILKMIDATGANN